MGVYVDDMRAPYRRMVMCHMLADSVEELHAMADKIGVARRWFQDKPKFPHYDICLTKRALAVKFGAKEVRDRDYMRGRIIGRGLTAMARACAEPRKGE